MISTTGKRVAWLMLAGLCSVGPCAAARRGEIPNPDFTAGEPVPDGATHDWTLGATGARGWMHSHKLETRQARQILITAVAKGSPADGRLKVGDVILGVEGRRFDSDARVAFGRALTRAEATEAGELSVQRWRDGRTETIELPLQPLGAYAPTAPYACPKSRKILDQGCAALAARISQPGYGPNPISRSLNALALLASGDEAWQPIVEQEARWAADYSVTQFSTWYYGYVITFLAEYRMITGDASVDSGLRRLVMEAVEGQSLVGSWGHRFAGDDGRLVGYGMMNAPGIPLTISLELARRAGIDEPAVAEAIERSAKLLRFYIGKGAIPYGDHGPWIETHEDNGKCGMAAVLFSLLEEEPGARFFSRMSLASHGSERDTGHTGNFWNVSWAMPGVNLSGPQATGAWMEEFGAWYYDLARGHDGLFVHQGPPQPGPDHTSGWDASGAYLLAYAMPLKKLLITGRQDAAVPELDAAAAAEILDDGRGWTNSERHAFYDSLATAELLDRLGSWSPVVRERAAVALSRRDDVPVERLVAMLRHESLETRLGACQALAQLGGRAAPAMAEVIRLFDEAEALWLRVKAAEVLAAIGPAARAAVPAMLKRLAQEPGPEDPRGMEQRYLCSILFGGRHGLFEDGYRGVDTDLLWAAIRAGLGNQDGRARGAFSKVFRELPTDQLRALLPEVHQSIVEPAPSGIMFADGIRLTGVEILTEWKVAEGIDACLFYLKNQNHWASEKRTPQLLAALRCYGAHAKRTIPELEALAARFAAGEPGFPNHLSQRKAEDVRETIAFLREVQDEPELISLP